MTKKTLTLPDAEDLDTTGYHPSRSIACTVYACATDEGAAIECHVDHTGGNSWPVRSQDEGWIPLIKYGRGVIGQSVIDALKAQESEIISLVSDLAYDVRVYRVDPVPPELEYAIDQGLMHLPAAEDILCGVDQSVLELIEEEVTTVAALADDFISEWCDELGCDLPTSGRTVLHELIKSELTEQLEAELDDLAWNLDQDEIKQLEINQIWEHETTEYIYLVDCYHFALADNNGDFSLWTRAGDRVECADLVRVLRQHANV